MNRNGEIAAQFEEIADRLLLQGESWFKVRAYRTAAETMRASNQDVAELSAADRLHELPGVGDAIAQKTADYLVKGSIPLLERLRAAVPDGRLALLRAGLTPAQVRALAEATGADSPSAVASLTPEQWTALPPRLRARVAAAIA